MIENAPSKQEQREILGVDKLVMRLTKMPEKETLRLKKDKVDALMRQMVNEIPYAYQVITPTLAESLLADSPQRTTDLELNNVLSNLGLSLFEPTQKEKLMTEVQLYLASRKSTEREYAASLMPDIVNTSELKRFPEKGQQELVTLGLLVLEKVINEKQLRMAPGYRLESLITIVEPFLYHRLFNVEMERLRSSHHLVFRKFVNAIAQDGYEKINDEKKLLAIQKEKQTAFNHFAASVKQMAVVYPALDTAHTKMRYLQKDRLIKQAEMKKMLDNFPDAAKIKTIGGTITYHLRMRVNEKLRRAFIAVESNPAIYENEFTIKQAHDDVYKIIKDDTYAIKYLIELLKTIRLQFHKSFMQIFSQRKALNATDDLLLNNILGEATIRTNIITKEKLSIRDGGYPKRSVKQIYTDISIGLAALEQNLTGIFAGKLKTIISAVLSELRKTSIKLSEGVIKEPEAAKATELPEATAVLQELKAAPPAKEKAEEKIAAASLPIAEKVAEKAPEKVEEKKVAAPPLPIAEEPVVKEKVITPLSLMMEEETSTTEEPTPVVEKVTAKPLLTIEEEEPLQLAPTTPQDIKEPEIKPEAKPLFIPDEEPVAAPTEQPEPVAKTEPKPLLLPTEEEDTAEPIQFEKVTPKPLLMADDEVTATVAPEPKKAATEMQDQGTQETLDAGAVIMKNYQLGDFEKPIYEAWKKMVAGSTEEQPTMGGGLIPLHSDNDVRLYVICDLAQQVSSVNAAQLSDEQKQILQNVKNQLLNALKNPLDEENWDYFEGSHRDIIDGQLGAVM